MNDVTTTAIHVALRGLATRQRAIADNIANLETPGYLAKRVEFEASLEQALTAGHPATTSIHSAVSADPAGANGNNVSLDTETLQLIDTNLRYQLGIEAVNAKFRLLRTSIG